ncbi:MAG: diguanylate cyclase [Oscillospiraceae bacterium]|nr:diguanylate cyclase [Oscillospiraceae bacterium]
MGLGHIVFDLITVITVNNRDIVPDTVNDLLHFGFYIFSMLFIMGFYNYVVKLTLPLNMHKKLRYIGYIPLLIFVVLFFFLPIEYVSGNGTDYSYGPLLFAGYSIFAVYCMICLALAIIKRNQLDLKTRIAILPTSLLMAVFVVVQAIIPELLMTSAGITIVCIGLFTTVNNPVESYKEQAYWDEATGVQNKNGFKKQLSYMEKKYSKKQVNIGFIICDMNGMKLINDNYGHAEGDKLIRAAAIVMKNCFKSAYNIYRVGGDEFAVMYVSPDEKAVQKELENAREACERYKDSPIKLSIAMGYASGIYSPDYMEIYNKADELMYKDKLEIKKLHPEFNR